MKEIVELKFQLNDLNIQEEELYRDIGYPHSNIPEPVQKTAQNVLASGKEKFTICGGWKLFDLIQLDPIQNKIKIGKIQFSIGGKIFEQLKNTEKLVLICVTAGPELETLAKKVSQEGDPLRGFVLDSLGSLIAEKTADKMRDRLKQAADQEGLKITNRFSPGYCSWNVEEQRLFFSLLPENFCGIQLSESALMIPIKSVSAIVGIGKNVRYSEYQCELCNQSNCFKRLKR